MVADLSVLLAHPPLQDRDGRERLQQERRFNSSGKNFLLVSSSSQRQINERTIRFVASVGLSRASAGGLKLAARFVDPSVRRVRRLYSSGGGRLSSSFIMLS